VQQAEEAAAEAESERLGGLGLELQRGVVQLQLLQRVAQRLVLVRLDRIEAGEHLRLDLLESGQRLASAGRSTWVSVSPTLGVTQFLDAGDDESDLAGRQSFRAPPTSA
jgi:hypothetical protein